MVHHDVGADGAGLRERQPAPAFGHRDDAAAILDRTVDSVGCAGGQQHRLARRQNALDRTDRQAVGAAGDRDAEEALAPRSARRSAVGDGARHLRGQCHTLGADQCFRIEQLVLRRCALQADDLVDQQGDAAAADRQHDVSARRRVGLMAEQPVEAEGENGLAPQHQHTAQGRRHQRQGRDRCALEQLGNRLGGQAVHAPRRPDGEHHRLPGRRRCLVSRIAAVAIVPAMPAGGLHGSSAVSLSCSRSRQVTVWSCQRAWPPASAGRDVATNSMRSMRTAKRWPPIRTTRNWSPLEETASRWGNSRAVRAMTGTTSPDTLATPWMPRGANGNIVGSAAASTRSTTEAGRAKARPSSSKPVQIVLVSRVAAAAMAFSRACGR
jgi:hypothetical protein